MVGPKFWRSKSRRALGLRVKPEPEGEACRRSLSPRILKKIKLEMVQFHAIIMSTKNFGCKRTADKNINCVLGNKILSVMAGENKNLISVRILYIFCLKE